MQSNHRYIIFHKRLNIAMIFVTICFGILLLRFMWLQIFTYHKYHSAAENNRIAIISIPAERGLIFDRNGIVIAKNYSGYTLEIDPSQIKVKIQNLIDELSTIISISEKDRKNFMKMIHETKAIHPFPIKTFLNDTEIAKFTTQHFRFPGVSIKAQLFRKYPYATLASHLIGYVGRVSQKDREMLISEFKKTKNIINSNIQNISHIGKVGVEQSYESELRGIPGFEQIEITAGGKSVRTISTTLPNPGRNLHLSIDIKLQYLVEELYGKNRGAFVAIEPKTGNILAFVSKPNFDPNIFVDGIDFKIWKDLVESSDKPLYNRPLKDIHPPGSTYKPFMALAALETKKRTPEFNIWDPGYFSFGNHIFRDDKIGGHGMVNMFKSIVHSCNTYYYQLASEMDVNLIHDFMKPFGFGQITGIDLKGEVSGILPSTIWKKKNFKKPEQQRWYEGDTISLGIGQGYNSFTILQLAYATAILSNNGIAMKPQIVKSIENPITKTKENILPKQNRSIQLNPRNLEMIKSAMIAVNQFGTAAHAFKNTNYISAGKTGTAQVFNLHSKKYKHHSLSESLRDHALYVVFAPANNPKIAIAMLVENVGFGATHAAPIARRALDYYLDGLWSKEVPEWKSISFSEK